MSSIVKQEVCIDNALRILVVPYVVEFINVFSGLEDDSLLTRCVVDQARDAQAMLFSDRDGKWALEFLGTCVRHFYEISESKDINPYIEGYKRIQESLTDFNAIIKIWSKYLLLNEYYDSRSTIWLKNGAHP